jgi:AraC family transcriptional regulator
MLLQGFYSETIGDETISYDPFTAVFHGSGLVHCDEIGDGGARFFVVELNDAWQETIERHGGAPQHAFELHGDGASWVALRLYHDFVMDTASEESAEESLLELCAYLPEAPPPDTSRPAWLDAVVRFLLKTFREAYSLRRLASDVGVDPSHLARTFYRFHRRTISDFVMRLRVQEACRQIGEFDRALSEIARTSGFSDQSHMTRAIRRLVGNTPAELRRVLQ